MNRGQGQRCAGFRDSFGDFAHCTRDEYAGTLPLDTRTEPPSFLHRLSECDCGVEHGGVRAPRRTVTATVGAMPPVTAEYTYVNADGLPVMRVTRHEDGQGAKTFRPWHNSSRGWVIGLNGNERIIYHADEVAHARPTRVLWWCEGEKDADRLRSLGLLATTYPGGAGKIDDAAVAAVGTHPVVVLVDNDDAGRNGARVVATRLHDAGIAVRVLSLSGLPDRGDVSDWLDAGGTVEELTSLAHACPSWVPSPVALVSVSDNVVSVPLVTLPTFPVDALPTPLRELAEQAEVAGAYPADFAGVFGVAALATAAGGLWEVEVRTGWHERPILWTGVVAESGSRKSPALRAVYAPLYEIGRDYAREHRAAIEEWKRISAATPKGETKPPRPVAQRITTSDTTIERLVRLLAENMHGVGIVADEIRSVIGALNQYKGGRGNDRTHLLSLWNGDDVTIDRVGVEAGGLTIYAERPTVCITGGIQPAVASALDGEDGLPARFLLAYPAVHRLRYTGTDMNPTVIGEWYRLVRAMVAVRPNGLFTVQIGDGSRPTFDAAAERYGDIADAADSGLLVRQLALKMPGYLARIALVLWVARHVESAATAPVVGARDIENAERICDYFLAHAGVLPMRTENLLASVSDQRADDAVLRLVTWLRARPEGRTTTRRDVTLAKVAGCRTAADVDRLIRRFAATYPGCVVEDIMDGQPRTTLLTP